MMREHLCVLRVITYDHNNICQASILLHEEITKIKPVSAQEQTEAIQHVLPRRAAAASTRPPVAAHLQQPSKAVPLS